MFSKRGAVSGVMMDLYACLGCSHMYFDPMPDQESLNSAVYSNPAMFADLGMPAHQRYATMLDHIWSLAKPPARLLDYGSGNGSLARHLKSRGYAVECFEPSEYARANFDYSALPTYSSPEDVPEGAYDIVIAVEVVEHCLHPLGVFSHVARSLKPGGVFYYTTGVFDNLESICRYIQPEQHLNFFTTRSARAAVERGGMQVYHGNCATGWPLGVKPKEEVCS